MPDKNTFNINPIRELIGRYIYGKSIDPFANSSRIATVTNDLNPDYETDYSMDAAEFMGLFRQETIDTVLYDPPYSMRQVSECYKGVGVEVTSETTQSSFFSSQKAEIRRILKPGGFVIKCGWNSNGVGGSDMELIEVLMVAHGGAHNDTIVTVERKIQCRLPLE